MERSILKILAVVALLVVVFAVTGAFALFRALQPRQVACGLPGLRNAAPHYLAVEAMPTTQPNVWNRAVGAYGEPPREQAIDDLDLPSSWAPCDENKPVPAEYAVRYVGEAWFAALKMQNELARSRYIESGGIPMDPRCLPYMKAVVRSDVPIGYRNLGKDEGGYGVTTEDLEAVPYFDHVVSLWKDLAAETDLTLPPVGSEMSAWAVAYFDKREALEKRAPSDKDCLPLDATP